MRTIKFRAWDVHNKKIIFPAHFSTNEHGGLNFSSMELMQYTGLHDKNGKPIFEGDVLEYPASPRLQYVTWDTEMGRWLDVEDHERCSIIGNVYENQELLK